MDRHPTPKQFDFGENWTSFSSHSLTEKRIQDFRQDFAALLEPFSLRGKTFLDIGFGQGLALFTAAECGAKVLGIDINSKNLQALHETGRFFPNMKTPETYIASILDQNSLKGMPQFDLVHSWGVLHHTGDMDKAIRNAASLVKPSGFLVLAIYNQHWTSPIWTVIKKSYVSSPAIVQRALILLFYPLIFLSKWLVTRQNPSRKDRGMDFYHDVVDWVGGFPYEYASLTDMIGRMTKLGFECVKTRAASVPTGCNEFVFRKLESSEIENPDH